MSEELEFKAIVQDVFFDYDKSNLRGNADFDSLEGRPIHPELGTAL